MWHHIAARWKRAIFRFNHWAICLVPTARMPLDPRLTNTEALGLGDVHLMACAGAAFGWRAAVIGFFVAPFVGMVAWAISLARSAPWRIPYGPSLAIGATSAYFASPALDRAVGAVLSVMQVAADRARDQPEDLRTADVGKVIRIGVVAAPLAR